MNVTNYKRKLLVQGEVSVFKLPWGAILLKNISKSGDLISYNNVREFKKKKRQPMWVTCNLVIFRNQLRQLYPVFCCNLCKSMKAINQMSLDQNDVNIEILKCIHSRTAEDIAGSWGNWQTLWPINLNLIRNNTENFKVWCNDDILYETLIEEDQFLAVVQKKKKISVLCTLSKKMKKPICQRCSSKPCNCYVFYKEAVERNHRQLFPNEEPQFFWDQRKNDKPQPNNHYENNESFKFGYNKAKVLYPLTRDPEFHAKLLQDIDLPDRIDPVFRPDILCSHGAQFDPNDNMMKLIHKTVTIYSKDGETTKNTSLYGRPTLADCRCYLQPDLKDYCLWNSGTSKLFTYTFLLSAVHKLSTGVPINAQVSARELNFTALGN